ncbi:MAG: hypothetical protein J7K98_02815 [Candidatus Aenigmarchaeota archaeon]|nr:hypothetical protein [Candidatus Aenigmarchaeota archaeon]
MNGMSIVTALGQLVNSTLAILPSLVGATIIWISGLVLAWVLSKITKEILLRLRVDKRLNLPAKGIFSTAEVFPTIVFWAVFLISVQEGLSQLGLEVLSTFFGNVVSFLGGIIEALVIILVGYALTDYVTKNIRETKKPFSEIIANFVFFIMMYIVFALALPFIGIDTTLINAILVIILASIGIGLAIAIGLGLKDTIARIAKKYEKQLTK